MRMGGPILKGTPLTFKWKSSLKVWKTTLGEHQTARELAMAVARTGLFQFQAYRHPGGARGSLLSYRLRT